MLYFLLPGVAHAAVDADLTAMVTSTGGVVAENMKAVLTTGFPLIVGVGLFFWGAFWIFRKMKGHAK